MLNRDKEDDDDGNMYGIHRRMLFYGETAIDMNANTENRFCCVLLASTDRIWLTNIFFQ